MGTKSEREAQQDGIGAKVRNLVSRRGLLAAAGSLAASLPYNVQVADLASKWLAATGLDKRV